MASSGKKGKKNKGKTLSLTSFHAEYSGGTGNDSTTVVVPKSSWADEMDDYDEGPIRKEQIVLPTAPRAARGPDISDEKIPRYPPFTAYIANLSYDVNTDVVMKFFGHLKIKGVRLPRDNDSPDGRLKGFGYADFEDRESLIEALTMKDQPLQNRKIKIDLATQAGRGDRDGDRRGYDRRGYGEEQGEEHKSTNWRSDPPPVRERDDGYGDRRGGDRDRGFDRYEPPRDRYSDDRRGGYGRDRYDREDRYGGDRGYGGYDRNDRHRDDRYDRNDRYGGRGDRYGDRNDRFDRRRSPEPPRERQKLNLQKRSVPADEGKTEAPSSSSSIFGGAKPVDTAKKEAEIERKLQEQQKKLTLPSRKSESEDSEPKKSIFGSAKPIDTSSREREVEERLRKMDLDKKKIHKDHHNGREEPEDSWRPKADVFGSAKPVDTSSREREVEERLRAREQEREERRSHDGDRRDIHSERRGGGKYNRRGGRGGGGERRDHYRNERRSEDRSPPPMKKMEEKPPNFVGSNKFSSLLNEDDAGSGHDSN